MFSSGKFNFFFTLVIFLPIFFLSSCGESSEYGKRSDYEKLGYYDLNPPTVSSVSPTDNSTDVSDSTTVAVTFSKKMSTSSITTNTSDTICSGSFQLSSDNFTTCIKMSANPVASDNDTTFTATPASALTYTKTFKTKINTSVKDFASNSLANTYTTNGFTTQDNGTVRPSVSSVSPTDNSTNVSVSTTVAVTFSKKMSTNSITTNTDNTTCSGSFQLSSDNFSNCIKMSVTPVASDNDTTFTVTPDSNLIAAKTFKTRVTDSVKDTDNNTLAITYTTNGFTTACSWSTDITAPTLSSESPKDNSTYNSVATTPAVTFSEAMTTSSITTNTSDTTCSGSFQLSSDNFSTCIIMSAAPVASDNNTTFTVTPASNLSADTTFRRKITTSAADTSCNTLGSDNTSIVGFSTSPSGSGTISGTVQDQDGDDLSGVNVNFKLYGSTAGDATSADNGSFSQSSLGLGVHTLTYSKSGYLDAVLADTLESDGETLVVETVRLLSDSCASGTMSGTITDAVTGDNMSGVGMWYASGMNKDYYIHTDEFTFFGYTDANGAWSLSDKNAGWYTINSWKSGYYDGYVNVFACGNQPNQDNSLSTTLDPGAMRIILQWPATTPATGDDFDSHLFIPYTFDNGTQCDLETNNTSDRDGKCHLWFRTNQESSVTLFGQGSTSDYHIYTDIVSSGDYVTLDIDERDAPGRETMTISKVRSGVYSYSVHNYGEKNAVITDSESTIFKKSRAKVKVFYNDGSKVYRKNFHVPNDNGTLWRVFTFDKDASGPFTRVKTMNIGVKREDIY